MPRFSWRYWFLRVYGAFFDVYDFIITHKCRKQKKVWFNDPSKVDENRLATHTQLRMLESVEGTLFDQGDILSDSFLFSGINVDNMLDKFRYLNNCSKWTLFLDGDDWLFFLTDKPLMEDVSFAEVEYDDSSWSNVQVPLSWQRNGFGQTIYTNIAYPTLDNCAFKRPLVSYEQQ